MDDHGRGGLPLDALPTMPGAVNHGNDLGVPVDSLSHIGQLGSIGVMGNKRKVGELSSAVDVQVQQQLQINPNQMNSAPFSNSPPTIATSLPSRTPNFMVNDGRQPGAPEVDSLDEEPAKEDNGRFKCKYCDYKTTRKDNLNNHERKHTGDKPYECHECNYR